MSIDRIIREEARLIILKALAGFADETLNSNILVPELASFGINRERAWVHDEMRYLEQMGAVTLAEAASVLVATLTDKGHRHLDRHLAIEGVKRPSRPEV